MTALLVETILENSATRLKTRALEWTLSLAAHGILLAAIFMVPLYWIDGIDTHPSNYTQLVATSAELGANAEVTAEPKSVADAASKLAMPKSIPNRVAEFPQLPAETDAGPEMAPDIAGIMGIVGQKVAPNGLLDSGGSSDGISSASVPPPAQEARPMFPLSVGGRVKAPRLIALVEPVYPALLRRARVQGDVVIDAMIDTQGNVVEAHAVSGNDLLVPAAMDALRRWKYEPTVLDGRVFPVLLRVTIAFRLGGRS
ncbi:MAG: TonB family protein [Acidobacteriia bacterium]|nr:TonB family protein [Terriglobia bacterium]